MNRNPTVPATERGRTVPAGAHLDDGELTRSVARQTSPDAKVAPLFRREAGGALTDRPVQDARGDDLNG